MSLINYISIIAVPFVIFYIIAYGFFAKIKVFDSFLVGCKEGINTVIKIFPTLVGLFLAISALRNSGILELISNIKIFQIRIWKSIIKNNISIGNS